MKTDVGVEGVSLGAWGPVCGPVGVLLAGLDPLKTLTPLSISDEGEGAPLCCVGVPQVEDPLREPQI